MFNSVQDFFNSDTFWGILFSSIITLLLFIFKIIHKFLKLYKQDKQQLKILQDISCLKNDLIIELLNKKRNKARIEYLTNKIKEYKNKLKKLK